MDPVLIFFIIRSLLRVGTAARDAYEQSVRDKDFVMPELPFPESTLDERIQEYFNQKTGLAPDLTKAGGPLRDHWVDDDNGGMNKKDTTDYAAILAAMAALKRDNAVTKGNAAARTWVDLRTFDEEAMTGLLKQWSADAQPVEPWARIGLALADVALDYVGTNPGIVGVGSSGETLIKAVCANLQSWIPRIEDGTQAFFVERMAAAILQSGLKTLSDHAHLVLTDEVAADFVGKLAQPLTDLFAKAVTDQKPIDQLTLTVVRDTVFPQLVSAGLNVLAERQQQVLGGKFDPNDTLGYFTKGFLQALSQQPVTKLGSAQAWVPIYQSLLRAAAAKPNLLIKGTTQNDRAIQDLITGMATKLADAPLPYTRDTAIDLGLVVIDELQQQLPTRTKDPWVLVVPAALQAVVEGLRNGGGPISNLAQAELSAVIRVILKQAAATPGMIVGNGSSVEVQAIITSVASAMAQDDKFLISEDGWTQIAAVATSAAARNPGKLFKIDDATPEGQLAGKLLAKLLAKASAGFSTTRSGNVVLFGDTLAEAIGDTLKAAAGNSIGALQNIDQLDVLVDRLNQLATDPSKPIGAADWSWLYGKLVAEVFDKGAVNFTDVQLRQMLLNHLMPGN